MKTIAQTISRVELNNIYLRKSPVPEGFHLAFEWGEAKDVLPENTTIVVNQTEDCDWGGKQYCFCWLEADIKPTREQVQDLRNAVRYIVDKALAGDTITEKETLISNTLARATGWSVADVKLALKGTF